MTEAEKSAILLRVNKEKQIAALKQAGIELDINTATGTDIANAMKWACGLLDLCVAAYHKATKKLTFFTEQEWNDLSSNTRYSYLTIGIRIRAYGKQWIVGKEDMPNDSGGTDHAWAEQMGWDIDELKNYGNPNDGSVFDDYDGEGNTDKIVAYAKANNRRHPAAERVRAYSLSSDDPAAGKYYLPSIAQLLWLQKRKVRFPKDYKYEFANQMFRTLVRSLTLIRRANSNKQRRAEYLAELLEELDVYMMYIGLCDDLHLLSREKEMPKLMLDLTSIARQAQGWYRASTKTTNGYGR